MGSLPPGVTIFPKNSTLKNPIILTTIILNLVSFLERGNLYFAQTKLKKF